MILNKRQADTAETIKKISEIIGVDPVWTQAVGMVESSLGENQKSPTGCRGVFQMSGIAMKDLLQEMEKKDDDMIDICCGILFLRLLLLRHGNITDATGKFCDPKDRSFYVQRVINRMQEFS